MSLEETRRYWDNEAAQFDLEPDHGLQDPAVLAVWTAFIQSALPMTHANVLDIGCGTGSLSVLLARLGHSVTAVDLSPAMIAQAKNKASAQGFAIDFHVMDAAQPQLPTNHFDAIVCRHLLWSLPNQNQVLKQWAALLRPHGRLVLVEGFWQDSGLHADDVLAILPTNFDNIAYQNMADNPTFWGKKVTDERYAITAEKRMDASVAFNLNE